MIRARILTPWTGAGTTGDEFRPQLAADYQLASWTDVTGQASGNLPPTPNLLTVEAMCTQAVLDAISLDARYEILWSETT